MLTGIRPVKDLKLDIKYGDISVTSKGVLLNESQVVTAPSVQVCPSAQPSRELGAIHVIALRRWWERHPGIYR